MSGRIHIATGEEITNPRTGQRMAFRRTGGDSDGAELIIECWSPPPRPGEAPEPVHVHPRQQKTFRVIEGELAVSIRGEKRVLRAGDELVVASDAPHSFWNESASEVHYWQEFRPALRSAEFFATLFALARDGKLNERGMPGMLQTAASISHFRDEIMVVSPPPWVQRLAFALLAPLARATGHEAERR